MSFKNPNKLKKKSNIVRKVIKQADSTNKNSIVKKPNVKSK